MDHLVNTAKGDNLKKKLSISIMAHPKRVENFDYLQERLDGIAETPMAIDGWALKEGEGTGVWENCKRAWRMHDPAAEYHVVIQDDAIICDNFRTRAEKVIADSKEKECGAISFFFGRRLLMGNMAKNGSRDGYVKTNGLHWGLAVCLPVKLIEPMIAFGDKMNIPQDDARISTFLRKNKIPVYYPIPSLVDHRIGESLVGDPGKKRVAYKYIDENK